jgi:hypothetical protein
MSSVQPQYTPVVVLFRQRRFPGHGAHDPQLDVLVKSASQPVVQSPSQSWKSLAHDPGKILH